MYLAMNPDKLKLQQRCASISDHNFEGRQGNRGRTHLMSPAMAAAAAVSGAIADVRKFPYLATKAEDPHVTYGDTRSNVLHTKSYTPPGAITPPVP